MAAAAPFAMLVDTSKCTGCRSCQVACKQWNGLPGEATEFAVSYENPLRLGAETWRRVKFIEVLRGEGEMQWLFLTDTCKHCAEAGCMTACPTGAIRRTEQGAVLVDADVCNGCRACIPACPYGVMGFDAQKRVAQKCTFCPERVANGREPACTEACPTDALTFGPREELLGRAEARVTELRSRGVKESQIYGKEESGGLGVLHVLENRPALYGLPEAPPPGLGTAVLDSVLAFGAVLATAGTVIAASGRGWNRLTLGLSAAGAALAAFALLCGFAARDRIDAYTAGDPTLRAQSPRWNGWFPALSFFSSLSAGAYFVAGLFDFCAPVTWTNPIIRYGYAVSFFALLPALACLGLALGRPRRVLHYFLAFETASPLSVGAWATVLFSGFAALAWFETWHDSVPFADTLRPAAEWLNQHLPRLWVGLLGTLPAAVVGSYTGIALGASHRPVWMQSRVLGALYFTTGVFAALGAILGALIWAAFMFRELQVPLGAIGLFVGVQVIFYLVALLVLLGPWGNDLISGRRAPLYWLGVMGLGLLAPLLLHFFNIEKKKMWRELGPEQWLLIGGALLGAALLRALVVSAGQIERTPPRKPIRLGARPEARAP